MKKNLLLLMLALLLPAFMYGQEQTVSGTVLDTYNMGVPGASIVEKGTTNGTITDFDGNYTLTVSNKNATLVFSFIFLEFVLLVHDTSHNTLSFSALKKEKNDFYILGLTPLKNN